MNKLHQKTNTAANATSNYLVKSSLGKYKYYEPDLDTNQKDIRDSSKNEAESSEVDVIELLKNSRNNNDQSTVINKIDDDQEYSDVEEANESSIMMVDPPKKAKQSVPSQRETSSFFTPQVMNHEAIQKDPYNEDFWSDDDDLWEAQVNKVDRQKRVIDSRNEAIENSETIAYHCQDHAVIPTANPLPIPVLEQQQTDEDEFEDEYPQEHEYFDDLADLLGSDVEIV